MSSAIILLSKSTSLFMVIMSFGVSDIHHKVIISLTLKLTQIDESQQMLCISYSVAGPAFSALLPDIVPSSQRAKVSSLSTAFQQIGGILGCLGGIVSVLILKFCVQALET